MFARRFLPLSLLTLAVLIGFGGNGNFLLAAGLKGPIKKLSIDPGAEVVNLFEGLKQGELALRVSPRNEFLANVFIGNPTAEAKTVALPEGAVGVHVLLQNQNQGPGFFTDSLDNSLNQGNQLGSGQRIGGSFSPAGNFQFPGGNSNQQFNQSPNNNFFSIPPETFVQLQMNTVCLDHGKPDPQTRMSYTLCSLEDYTENTVLQQLLKNFDPEENDREAVQAAAWHLANDMSWKELESKRERRLAGVIPYFTKKQLKEARQLVEQSQKQAAQEKKKDRPSRVEKKL